MTYIGKYEGYRVYKAEGANYLHNDQNIYLKWNPTILLYEMWLYGEKVGVCNREYTVLRFKVPEDLIKEMEQRNKEREKKTERPIVEDTISSSSGTSLVKEVKMDEFFDRIGKEIDSILSSAGVRKKEEEKFAYDFNVTDMG